jgi:hypothetical protein
MIRLACSLFLLHGRCLYNMTVHTYLSLTACINLRPALSPVFNSGNQAEVVFHKIKTVNKSYISFCYKNTK